ncbi:Uncharacterized protein SCF082_LOCUS43032, partial [Durusdinium trenchii]
STHRFVFARLQREICFCPMGCGASQKYEVSENTQLSALDDTPEMSRSSSQGGLRRSKEEFRCDAKYRVNDREGPEEPWEGDPGDSDLVKAVAAANDDKLLLKYAQRESEGCRVRRGGRVFAPSGGELQYTSYTSDSEDFAPNRA